MVSVNCRFPGSAAMPASLLGLLAIGTFYVITVVVGLCANRCLSYEDDDEDGGNGDDSEHGNDLDLLRLLEASLGATTRTASAVAGLPTESSNVSLVGNSLPLRNTPLVQNHVHHPADNIEVLSDDPTSRQLSPGADSRLSRQLGDMESLPSLPPKLPPGGRYLLAERNVGVILGSLSLLAIKTGGIFPSSIAQQMFEQGLVWCQMPIASSLSLIIGGALFSRALYQDGHVTMIDPFQAIYGSKVGIILFIPVLIADLLFVAVVLCSLGSLQHLALGVSPSLGVLCSVIAILLYLACGGFYAGTFTDGVQFIYLCLGMLILCPANVFNSHTGSLTESISSWIGKVNGRNSGLYIDQLSMLILGSIPAQSFYQRILSSRTTRVARTITIVSSIGCLIQAIPSILIGAAATTVDWKNVTKMELTGENRTVILSFSLSYLVPDALKLLTLGALTSGLLASGDSVIFGLATMFTQNIYRCILRPRARERELVWFARGAVLGVCLLALVICLIWPHWHRHWLLPFDLLYVLVFPQLFCVVYFKYSNSWGALSGLIVSALLRVSLGEERLHLKAHLPLPFYTDHEGQLFPYRTLAMLANLLTVILVSLLVDWLHRCGRLASVNDICACSNRRKRVMRAPSSAVAMTMNSAPSAMTFERTLYTNTGRPLVERMTAL